MKNNSQKAAIIGELMTGVTLTPLDAIRRFGCTKLSSRIGEIERELPKMKIDRGWLTVKTRYGKTTVRTYRMKP